MRQLNLNDITLSGLNLIEASAGTGKTWTIAALYMLLLLEIELKPENILVVTYTKAATAELRERLRQRISSTLELFESKTPARDELEKLLLKKFKKQHHHAVRLLTRALYSFDDAAIFTIHGFCQRALSENAFESGSLFDTELTADPAAIIQEAADDFWRIRFMARNDHFMKRLIAERKTPDSLLSPFKGNLQNMELSVLPETAGENYNNDAKQLNTLFLEAAQIWENQRDIIVDLLKSSGLNQQSYKPSQIDTAVVEINYWFSMPPLKSCNKLLLFSSEQINAKTKKGCLAPQHNFFELCQKLYQAALGADSSFKEQWAGELKKFYNWLKDELPRRKRLRNLRSYDDLLTDLYQALIGTGGNKLAAKLRERYHAAMIDEFQDTDTLQWQIFKKMAGVDNHSFGEASENSYPLYLIGDPKQAIYSFRGADLFTYLEAASSVKKNMRWSLDTNRRSTATLVKAVNSLFEKENPFLHKLIIHQAVQAGRNPDDQLLINGIEENKPLRLWLYQKESEKLANKSDARDKIAVSVAAEVARVLSGGYKIKRGGAEKPVRPGDIALLVRTHSQAELIQNKLSRYSIPSVQLANMTIFQSQEALDLLRILRAIAEPHREALLAEALLTESLGLNLNIVFTARNNEEQWEEWLARFHKMRQLYQSSGVISISSFLLYECALLERLLQLHDGERRITNFLHIVELLHQYAEQSEASIESAIIWLEKRVTAKSSDEATLLRLETDDNAVRIETIHASKGLQYPIVFIPYAWDTSEYKAEAALFHNSENGKATLDLGSREEAEHKQLAEKESDAEAIRLLYVAITRAEFKCYLVWGAINQADKSPLFRLIHGDDSLALKELSNSEIMLSMQRMAEKADGIQPELMPKGGDIFRYNQDSLADQALSYKNFTASINKDWRISSFSSITVDNHSIQPQDRDAVSSAKDNEEPTEEPSIFDFPKGAAAGTCLHEIFERLNYANLEQSAVDGLIIERLQANGYNSDYLPVIRKMIEDLVKAPLILEEQSFNLASLKQGAWKVEMGFFLPVKEFSNQVFRNLFIDTATKLKNNEIGKMLEKMHIKQGHGMLQGFIDMIFEHNGRYYIIDWKSNYLGNKVEAYNSTAINQAMLHHSYIIQYHLYTLALDRLLKLRLAGYNYKNNFGGVIYLFLRGVSAKSAEYGIYRNRPSEEFIQKANQQFLG